MIPYIVLTIGICMIAFGVILYIKDVSMICTWLDERFAWSIFALFGASLIVHALIYILVK